MPAPLKEDLATSTRRCLRFGVAVEELGLSEGVVMTYDLLRRACTFVVGGSSETVQAMRRELVDLGMFEVFPKETRGKGTNFVVYQGIPESLAGYLADDVLNEGGQE